jgi:hypothetical protein
MTHEASDLAALTCNGEMDGTRFMFAFPKPPALKTVVASKAR